MKAKVMSLKFGDLKIRPAKNYCEMGYGNNIPDPMTVKITKSFLAKAEQIVTPRFYYDIFKGNSYSDYIQVENASLKTNSPIAKLLTGARLFAVFITTAGILYQKWYDSIAAENNTLKSFIADTIGSRIAETAGNIMEKEVEKHIDV